MDTTERHLFLTEDHPVIGTLTWAFPEQINEFYADMPKQIDDALKHLMMEIVFDASKMAVMIASLPPQQSLIQSAVLHSEFTRIQDNLRVVLAKVAAEMGII